MAPKQKINKSTPELKVQLFDPKKKKTDGRKRVGHTTEDSSDAQPQKRGGWTHKRQLALLNSYKDYRPYGVAWRSRTEQWMKMLAVVNKQDPQVTPVKKHAMIDQFKQLLSTYKSFFDEYKNSQASGSNRVNPDMLRAAYDAWNCVSCFL